MDSCPSYNSLKYKVYNIVCTKPPITNERKELINPVIPYYDIKVNFNDYKSNCKMVSSEHCDITNLCALGK